MVSVAILLPVHEVIDIVDVQQHTIAHHGTRSGGTAQATQRTPEYLHHQTQRRSLVCHHAPKWKNGTGRIALEVGGFGCGLAIGVDNPSFRGLDAAIESHADFALGIHHGGGRMVLDDLRPGCGLEPTFADCPCVFIEPVLYPECSDALRVAVQTR